MHTAGVYHNHQLAGFLTKTETGTYQFEYLEAYWLDPNLPAISLTLPKTQKIYHSPHLFPFFVNLLAEGANRQLQCRHLQIDENDDFSLLLATAQWDTIGAITLQAPTQ